MKRVGIYAGTFNPVHAGHIGFALQAMARAHLDKLYFLPERRPRQKSEIEHFGHRVAMLRQALKPHPRFDVLELPDVSFSVEHTLPRLQGQFMDDRLVFLFGSDAVQTLGSWPLAGRLLKNSELVIGLRQLTDALQLEQAVQTWPVAPLAWQMFVSHAPGISSSHIRSALRQREYAQGLLTSVQKYSLKHWLYVSLA